MDYTHIKPEILNYLEKNLSCQRVKHCINVSKFSAALAKKHNANVQKAQIAGLIHDCAKNKSAKEQIALCSNKKKIKYFDLIAKNAPDLLHSYNSALIAEEIFNIKDKDILKAAANHTLGDENMSLLEKIIYIADAVSFERKCAHAAKMRKLAMIDFEAAFVEVMKNKIEYVLNTYKWICPKCIDVWNFYVQKK